MAAKEVGLWSFTINNKYTHSFKMQDHATVHQAELETIYHACTYMDDKSNELKPNMSNS